MTATLLRPGSKLVGSGGHNPFAATQRFKANPRHFAYQNLIAAFVPQMRTAPVWGPVGASQAGWGEPVFTSGAPTYAGGTADGGPGWEFGTSGKILKGGNKGVWGGFTQATIITRYRLTTVAAVTYSIFRKDGEFTLQVQTTGNPLVAVWTASLSTLTSGGIFAANDIVDHAGIYDGVNVRCRSRKNFGAMASGATAKTGTIATLASTPLCMGGTEGGGELPTGVVYYVYCFNVGLSLAQVQEIFDDPWSVLIPAAPEFMAIAPAAAAASTILMPQIWM